jgi:methylthioribose-1-phosphate isomerase
MAIPSISRRMFLRHAPAVAAVAALPVVPAQAAPEAKFDLQGWLDTAEPLDVIRYHALHLGLALTAMHGGRWELSKIPVNGNSQHQIIMYVQRPGEHDCFVQNFR